MTDHGPHDGRTEPPAVPAARRRDGSDGVEHAQPGDDWPTLCGIPADEVALYRHTFTANRARDCPRCAELVWRLDDSGPLHDFASLVWVDPTAPGRRLELRVRSVNEAGELLRMRFGDAAVTSVWAEDPDARAAGMGFVSEPERLLAADQVVVISGTGFDAGKRAANQRLAVERTSAAIVELAGLITDYRPGEPMDLMEWPAISVAFLEKRRLLAEYGLLSGATWVRTPTSHDWRPRQPDRLRAWLRHRGVEPV